MLLIRHHFHWVIKKNVEGVNSFPLLNQNIKRATEMTEERIRGVFNINGTCEELKIGKKSFNATYLKKVLLRGGHNIQEPCFNSSLLMATKKFGELTDDLMQEVI